MRKSLWGRGFQGYFRPTKVAINLQRKSLGIKKPSRQSPDPGTRITLFSRLKTITVVKGAAPPGVVLTGNLGVGVGWGRGELAPEGQTCLEREREQKLTLESIQIRLCNKRPTSLGKFVRIRAH